jgi:hypothetical protein
MKQRPNIYAESLFQHERIDTNTVFMMPEERNWIRDYESDHFKHLQADQGAKMENLMLSQPEVGRTLRMKVIEWLFEIVNKFKIREKAVVI